LVKTKVLNGETIVDMLMMEAMIHNRMCSSSIKRAEKSGEKQEIQGTVVGIQMMEVENHIKTGIVKPSKRQAKMRKFQDDHKKTLYAKW